MAEIKLPIEVQKQARKIYEWFNEHPEGMPSRDEYKILFDYIDNVAVRIRDAEEGVKILKEDGEIPPHSCMLSQHRRRDLDELTTTVYECTACGNKWADVSYV